MTHSIDFELWLQKSLAVFKPPAAPLPMKFSLLVTESNYPSTYTSRTPHLWRENGVVKMFGRINIIVFAVLWASLHQVIARSRQHASVATIKSSKIPGGSPLRYCNVSRDTDLYQIDRIELYPSPLHMWVHHRKARKNPTLSMQLLSNTNDVSILEKSDDVFEVHIYG